MAVGQMTSVMADIIKQARSNIPEAIAVPTRWPQMYETFISQNASSVSQIESALRSLTYIIPGRFRESEIASESLHSGVQLLSLYHDSLLARAISRLPPSLPRPLPTLHNRYTKFWTAESSLYRRVALVLQTIQYTELLWEMAAKRKGEKIRWRVVVILEMVKALCRLLMMRLTNSRPLVTSPLPDREVDPRTVEGGDTEKLQWDGMRTPPIDKAESDALNWTMPRTGLSLPTLPDSTEITEYLLKKVLTADDIKAPKQLLHRVTTFQGQLAESMWILRPVIYALAMQRWQSEKKSWRPWLLGASLELAARQLAKKDLAARVAGGLRGLTRLEVEELKKRGWSMAWWVMRGAFYENITKSCIHSVTGSLKGKPLLDMVGSVIEDYEYLWTEYYFSTATL
ncbi:Peroxisomal membrane protein pex16 [Xylographa opegraphella]|nr:Peroxisomal membrane protein pex16 [Xylographa opegraphella]